MYPWSGEATAFAPQMGSATGRALCVSTSMHRTIEWAMHLPVCSGYITWLNRLMAIFSNEWGYELDFLPGCSGRSSSKAARDLCYLSSSQPAPQVP